MLAINEVIINCPIINANLPCWKDWNGLRIISRVGEVSRPVPVSLWFQEQLQIWNLCLGSDTLPVMVKNQSSFPFICPGICSASWPLCCGHVIVGMPDSSINKHTVCYKFSGVMRASSSSLGETRFWTKPGEELADKKNSKVWRCQYHGVGMFCVVCESARKVGL